MIFYVSLYFLTVPGPYEMLSKYLLNKQMCFINIVITPAKVQKKKKYHKMWTQCGREIILALRYLLVRTVHVSKCTIVDKLKSNKDQFFLILQYMFGDWINETPIRERYNSVHADHIPDWMSASSLVSSYCFVFSGMVGCYYAEGFGILHQFQLSYLPVDSFKGNS